MWEDLIKAALVGTDKAPPLALNGGTLAKLAGGVAGRSNEDALLSLAGATALQEMAGYITHSTGIDLPEQAAADERPLCSDTAVQQLAMRLLEQDFRLMEEWVRLCDESQLSVPARYMPLLLAHLRARSDLYPQLRAVTGPRGAWLSQFQPEWQPIFAAVPDEEWHADDLRIDVRVAALRSWREQDATAARESLMKHMPTFNAAERSQLVSTLAVDVSADDEDVLETLLDDRSKQVIVAAAEVLATLADSAYVARMIEYVKDRVTIDLNAKKEPLKVHLYTSLDDNMKRDGLDRANDRTHEVKTRWFANMIAAIPPDYWEQRTGADAKTLLSLAPDISNTHVLHTLFVGWEQAAVNHNRPDWIRAALELRMERSLLNLTLNRRLLVEPTLYMLVGQFPPADVEQMVLDAMKNNAKNPLLPLVAWHNWAHSFSEDVLISLAQVAEDRVQVYTVSSVLGEVVHYCHPHVLPDVPAIFQQRDGNGYVERTINRAYDTFTEVLKRRRDMWEAFSHDG
ncbi:MAG: DUF5691 domain-containing protein [Chloroflexota bacterium]